MSASDKSGTTDGEVFAALPRTRPQRRSARRQSAAPAPGVTEAPVKPAAIQAAAKPGAKAAAKPATKKAAAKPGAKAAKAVAEAKPLITAGAKATPVAPLMDHPAPADMPGAPFAPPPPGGYAADAGSSDAPGTDSKGHDVVAAAAQAAGGLVQVGLGVAKTILARLPRR